MIYQGLREDRYYWEFVNILRKTVLVGINVFLSMYNNIFKALVSLIFMTCFLQL